MSKIKQKIRKGEVGRAWRVWNSERASTTATEDGLKAFMSKITDREKEYLKYEITDDECDPVTATVEIVKESIS